MNRFLNEKLTKQILKLKEGKMPNPKDLYDFFSKNSFFPWKGDILTLIYPFIRTGKFTPSPKIIDVFVKHFMKDFYYEDIEDFYDQPQKWLDLSFSKEEWDGSIDLNLGFSPEYKGGMGYKLVKAGFDSDFIEEWKKLIKYLKNIRKSILASCKPKVLKMAKDFRDKYPDYRDKYPV